jgi:predicted signal transduction protein with EAL and GGDEF domain
VIEQLSAPYAIDGNRVMIGASVGIAIAPDDGVTSEALIRNADLALYAAKDGGRGRYHFYAADLHSDAEERRQLEEDLRDAVAHGGLELYYQPVVQTATERITGSRRCCAGTIRSRASSPRTSSFRLPRTPA